MTTPTTTARIRSIEPLEVFALRLGCDHGTMREVDLADEFWGPVFEPVRNDPQLFPQAHADRELGTIVWSNRADLGPDVLHGDLPSAAPASAE